MKFSERRQVILDYIDEMDEVSTDFLASRLKTSRSTVYRDLVILEKEGYIKKTTNGAVKINDFLMEKNSYFSLGLRVDVKEKKTIARKAFEYINSGDSIILDAGTINFLIAKEINKSNIVNITAITNNIITQLILLRNRDKHLRVLATGGIIKDGCSSTLGDFIQHMMEHVKADKAFLTTKAIALDGSISELDYGEASIKQFFLEKAKTKILMTQSQKFGKVGIYRVANIKDFDMLITDDGIYKREEFLKMLRDNKIDIQVVKV